MCYKDPVVSPTYLNLAESNIYNIAFIVKIVSR